MRLIEILSRRGNISLVDFCNSNCLLFKPEIIKSYEFGDYLFTNKLFKRFNNIFRIILASVILKKKNFDYTFLIGCHAIELIPLIKHISRSKIIYVDDEFPWLFNNSISKFKVLLNKCDLIVSLDEQRRKILFERINIHKDIMFKIFPNIPAKKQLNTINENNWYDKLNLSKNLKYILLPGSFAHFNCTAEILTTFPLWDKNYGLILLGWNAQFDQQYGHLIKDNVFICNEILNDFDYNSITQFCVGTISLYSKYKDLEFTGMSSGKIMRSLLLNRPVITNNYKSFRFIAEKGMGILIDDIIEIPNAINKLEKLEDFHFINDEINFDDMFK